MRNRKLHPKSKIENCISNRNRCVAVRFCIRNRKKCKGTRKDDLSDVAALTMHWGKIEAY